MRPSILRLLVFAIFAITVAAWTKEDHEIFRLRDELIQLEGQNVTFYDFLGIKPSAAHQDIIKAYRAKSRRMHPDKAKRAFAAKYKSERLHGQDKKKKKRSGGGGVHVSTGPSKRELDNFVRKATQRYARLTTVRDILAGPARDRYDYFLKNGFPKWKGTGYYYSRFRPGLGTVLIGLFVSFGGVAHYVALVLSYKRQRVFFESYVKSARRTAWGDDFGIGAVANLGEGAEAVPEVADDVPDGGAAPLTRKQKRMMEKEGRKESRRGGARNAGNGASAAVPDIPTNVPGTHGERRRVTAENGKPLIVDSMGDVYLEEVDDEGNVHEHLINVDDIAKPTIKDTAVFRLPVWIWRRLTGKTASTETSLEEEAEEVEAEEVEQEKDEKASARSKGGARRRNKQRR